MHGLDLIVTLTGGLVAALVEPTIVEMNLDTIREVRDAGLHAIYGDATHPSVLGEARIAEARAFIIAVSPLEGVEIVSESRPAESAPRPADRA